MHVDFTPEVYVYSDHGYTSVYIRKPNGAYIAVYVGSTYEGPEYGGLGYQIEEHYHGSPYGEKVFHK